VAVELGSNSMVIMQAVEVRVDLELLLELQAEEQVQNLHSLLHQELRTQ
jgi:hypothetical protein